MQNVLKFWFEQLGKKNWFKKSESIDTLIRDQFLTLHAQVASCEMWRWRDEPLGRLAEIIVLDQFSRNMFRGQSESFAFDSLALALAQEAVSCGADRSLSDDERVFLYMPYMHSESAVVHERAVELFSKTKNLQYELRHKDIIDRFGRYPHRNAVLGRESTQEELDWMKTNRGF